MSLGSSKWRTNEGAVMDTMASPPRSIGGWAMFVDFSSLLLKASVGGVAFSLIAGGSVLLVALVG